MNKQTTIVEVGFFLCMVVFGEANEVKNVL